MPEGLCRCLDRVWPSLTVSPGTGVPFNGGDRGHYSPFAPEQQLKHRGKSAEAKVE